MQFGKEPGEKEKLANWGRYWDNIKMHVKWKV
jgi:hypothetical protein